MLVCCQSDAQLFICLMLFLWWACTWYSFTVGKPCQCVEKSGDVSLPSYCQIPGIVSDQVGKMLMLQYKKKLNAILLVLVRPELYRLDSQYKFGVSSRFGSIHLYFTEDGVKWLVTCVLSRLANAVLFLWAFLTLVSKILLHTYSQSCTLYNVIPPTTARSGDTVGFRKLSADSPRVCSFVDAVLLRLLMHY